MPRPGKRWRHVMINTKNSWLHGDPRGFRDRDHRLHSSGDYKNPPPEEEHEGLRDWSEARSGDEVRIPVAARSIIADAIAANLTGREHRTLVVTVTAFHAHIVVELPNSVPAIKKIIGWAKQKSSAAVTHLLPGTIWSAGETYKPVDTKAHLKAAFEYVRDQQGPGAAIWTFDGSHLKDHDSR